MFSAKEKTQPRRLKIGIYATPNENLNRSRGCDTTEQVLIDLHVSHEGLLKILKDIFVKCPAN